MTKISDASPESGEFAPVTIADPADYPDPLEFKLALAAGGCYLLPVKPGTKNPGSIAGKGWPRKTSRNPIFIRQWHEVGPEAAIAIHTGRSGLVVIDFDSDEIPGELDWLKTGLFQSSRGLLLDAGESTQRGHYVFASDTVFVSGRIKLTDGTEVGDVRSGNTIILSQPSRHPHAESKGAQYRWLTTGVVPGLSDCAVALGYLRVHPGDAARTREHRSGATYSAGFMGDSSSSDAEICEWAFAAFNDGCAESMCPAIRHARDEWICAVKTEEASYPNLLHGDFEILNLGAEGHTGWDAARGELEIAYYVEVVEERRKRPEDEVLGEIDRSFLDALRKIKAKVEQATAIGAVYTPEKCTCLRRKRKRFAYRKRRFFGYRPRRDFGYQMGSVFR
jgi:hypothetical protein